jgi:tetratricopeptide (TPR) repeat protein
MGRSKYQIASNYNKIKDNKLAKDSAVIYFVAADSAFAQLTAKYPTTPDGWQYRAKANNNLDPEMKTAAAKPFYEQFIKVAEASADPTKYKNFLIESYQFLGAYYLNTKDTGTARGYLTKALELDPNSEFTKELMKGL